MKSAVAEVGELPYVIRFGGWHDGDNHKPGRGWYFVCRSCGRIGLGQLLPASARRRWETHRCTSATSSSAAPRKGVSRG